MNLHELLITHDFILTEAAIIEALRRNPRIRLHPRLEHALLVYDRHGAQALETLYREFILIARNARVPLLICTPTWRANQQRLSEAGFSQQVNRDCTNFLKHIRHEHAQNQIPVLIGGLIGCRHDCYKPDEALPPHEALRFHMLQIQTLCDSGVDFLLAATLPSAGEATGIAMAMSTVDLPYLISFVINSSGTILDGTPLELAFRSIDMQTAANPPLGYMVNCAYPSFLHPDRQPGYVFKRLVGYQANASSKNQCELNNSAELQTDAISDWGDRMIELNRAYGVKILGGCCGTSLPHLRYIVERLAPDLYRHQT